MVHTLSRCTALRGQLLQVLPCQQIRMMSFTALVVATLAMLAASAAASPAPVLLGVSGDFAILSKSGITDGALPHQLEYEPALPLPKILPK